NTTTVSGAQIFPVSSFRFRVSSGSRNSKGRAPETGNFKPETGFFRGHGGTCSRAKPGMTSMQKSSRKRGSDGCCQPEGQQRISNFACQVKETDTAYI